MAKWFGKIGFAVTTETKPGVYMEVIEEHEYFGDLLKYIKRYENGDDLNSDINVANEISIIADPFANENVFNMRYAEFMGAKWVIKNVSVQYPRLILSLGGVYNGPESGTTGYPGEYSW